MGLPEHHTSEGDEKATKEMATTVHDNGCTSAGTVLPLEYKACSALLKSKPHVPSPEDGCVPQKMEGLEYLLVEPACEVNERGTREKNDGNENLSLDDNEKIDADSDAYPLRKKI